MTAPEHKIEYLSQTGTPVENPTLAALVRVSAAGSAVFATSKLSWKLPKTRMVKDPLAELIDVIRTVKAALSLPWDETSTRAKLADPVFRRAARKEPHVAAEFARRKAAAAPATDHADAAAL